MSISSYIDGDGIYNSTLLRGLKRLPQSGEYIIKRNEYRAELIASDIYGDSRYSEFLLFYNGLSNAQLSIGTKLRYPSSKDIQDLIKKVRMQ